MLSPESELLLRNKQYFESGKWLLANATDPEIFDYFSVAPFGFHQFFDSYINIHKRAKGEHSYSAFLNNDNQYDGIVIYWPKSKQHGIELCQHLASKLNNKGYLLIVGDNKGGVKSASKALEKVGFSLHKLDSARHCTLVGCQIDESHNLKGTKNKVNTYSINIHGEDLTLQNLPGTFSSDALDPGTELLLRNMNDLFENRKSKSPCKVLDFACGNGAIGLSIAKQFPNTVITMSDINSLALHCAEQNVTLNNIPTDRVNIVSSHILGSVTGKFDIIISNPPFHSGTKTDYSITEQFLREAKQQLAPKGKLRIVANRFLKYPDMLMDVFGNVKTLTKNSKFSIYECANS